MIHFLLQCLSLDHTLHICQSTPNSLFHPTVDEIKEDQSFFHLKDTTQTPCRTFFSFLFLIQFMSVLFYENYPHKNFQIWPDRLLEVENTDPCNRHYANGSHKKSACFITLHRTDPWLILLIEYELPDQYKSTHLI